MTENKQHKNQLTIVLTIAGSDSGGGAGIQADLKTFYALGVHGTSVLTAVTAQNTLGVAAWQAISSDLVMQQLEAVTGDMPPAAIKTGMLPDARLIERLSGHLKLQQIPLIVDPVLVASSGAALAEAGTVQTLVEHLLPGALLVTPNYPEAEALTGLKIRSSTDALQVAEKLMDTGCQAVLLKGGHGNGALAEDLLVSQDGRQVYQHPRLNGVFHGTGCTLSAAITAHIALGKNLEEAVTRGIDLVCQAMDAAVKAGSGSLRLLQISPDVS